MATLLTCDVTRSEHDPDLEAAAANTVTTAASTMHPVTGTFVDPLRESAFAAQLFCWAFPCHAVLMALSLAFIVGMTRIVAIELRVVWSLCVISVTLALVGRVLLHRMHDAARGQRIGSWAWTILNVVDVFCFIGGYVMKPAKACLATQDQYLASLEMPILCSFSMALINGSHGLAFLHKIALIALNVMTNLVVIAACGEDAYLEAFAGISALVLGTAVAHIVELHVRHGYAEKVVVTRRLAKEKMRLERRNEQLQAEKERLQYDVKCRGRAQDDDDRSAVCRGLRAGPSQIYQPNANSDSSETGAPAPSESPPPSMPPGPPSSLAASWSTTSCEAAGAPAPSDAPPASMPSGPSSSIAANGPMTPTASCEAAGNPAPSDAPPASMQPVARSTESTINHNSAVVPLSWADADRQFYIDRAARESAASGKRAEPLTWAEAERQRLAGDEQFEAERLAADQQFEAERIASRVSSEQRLAAAKVLAGLSKK